MVTVRWSTPSADVAETLAFQNAEIIPWLNMAGIHAKAGHMMLQYDGTFQLQQSFSVQKLITWIYKCGVIVESSVM